MNLIEAQLSFLYVCLHLISDNFVILFISFLFPQIFLCRCINARHTKPANEDQNEPSVWLAVFIPDERQRTPSPNPRAPSICLQLKQTSILLVPGLRQHQVTVLTDIWETGCLLLKSMRAYLDIYTVLRLFLSDRGCAGWASQGVRRTVSSPCAHLFYSYFSSAVYSLTFFPPNCNYTCSAKHGLRRGGAKSLVNTNVRRVGGEGLLTDSLCGNIRLWAVCTWMFLLGKRGKEASLWGIMWAWSETIHPQYTTTITNS